ncbi:hypothetical protein [Segetibacter aerophilus]|nr:hypothetical protein [Segetibacter aerophilus]
MTDDQFGQLLSVLQDINKSIKKLHQSYDLGDVCSHLDDVESAVKDVKSAVEKLER